MMDRLFGGIEAGGTKFVCAVGGTDASRSAGGPDELLAETRFPTTTPAETIGRAVEFFKEQQTRHGPLAAVGIASFGPVDPNPASGTFGYITTTPKPGWRQVDIAGPIRAATGAPVGFDTDVNGAALGEWRWGAAQGLDTFVYLTVGTGIGGGALANGSPLHGLLHPEMGHMRVAHDRTVDPYAGNCPFHGDCLEGLACGPAMQARWGQSAETLPPDHPGWALEAHYLGQAVANLVCTLSPQRIIIGGGVTGHAAIFAMIRAEAQKLLNGYVQMPAILEGMDEYVVPPGLGMRAGVLGAIALGERAVGH